MRTVLAVSLLVATSSIAGADPEAPVEDLPAQESAPAARIAPPPAPYPTTTYEYEMSGASVGQALSGVLRARTGFSAELYASAAGTTESDGASLGIGAVGGSLATGGTSERCRYLRVGATAYATFEKDRERTDSAHTSAAVCLFRMGPVDVAAPGFAIAHDMDHAVRPSLSARRLFLAGRYSSHTIRAEGSAFEGRDSKLPYGSALFPYRVRVDIAEQAGVRQVMTDVELEGIQITPPRTIFMGDPNAPAAVFHVPADDFALLGLFIRVASTDTSEVMFGGLDLARLTGLEIGGGVTLDMKLGLGAGGVDASAMEDTRSVDVISPRGYLGAAGATDALGWNVRYTRDGFPTFDGGLALEDRLSSTVELRRWVPGVAVTAFGAHTQLYALDGTTGDWTGGASATRSWALGDHLALAVTGEVARSYYARLDGDPRPTPSGGARVMAVITGRVGTD
jgi:hypothetical protein